LIGQKLVGFLLFCILFLYSEMSNNFFYRYSWKISSRLSCTIQLSYETNTVSTSCSSIFSFASFESWKWFSIFFVLCYILDSNQTTLSKGREYRSTHNGISHCSSWYW
jgi:hypothetical protein